MNLATEPNALKQANAQKNKEKEILEEGQS